MHVSYLLQHEVAVLVAVEFDIKHLVIVVLQGEDRLLVLDLISVLHLQNADPLIQLVVL